LRGFVWDGEFVSGSMGFKVEVVCWFVEVGGCTVVICSFDDIVAVFIGEVGIVIMF